MAEGVTAALGAAAGLWGSERGSGALLLMAEETPRVGVEVWIGSCGVEGCRLKSEGWWWGLGSDFLISENRQMSEGLCVASIESSASVLPLRRSAVLMVGGAASSEKSGSEKRDSGVPCSKGFLEELFPAVSLWNARFRYKWQQGNSS